MRNLGLVLVTILSLASCNPTEAGSGKQGSGSSQNFAQLISDVEAMPTYELSDDQKASLLFMWEEEKVARDVYITLGQTYGLKIFANISRSEQSHMDAVTSLIRKYNIPLNGSNDVGVFITQEFQDLYDELIARGMNSVVAALEVGRDIELLDIDDLQVQIQNATPDVALVYQKLLDGSYNHLSAFERNLSKY